MSSGRGHYPHKVLPHLGLRPTPLFVSRRVMSLLAVVACGGGMTSPSASPGGSQATVISSEYGRIWGRLPADFPLLAEGSAETRLDLLASGSIFSRLGVEVATRSAVDELRRLAWDVVDPVSGGRYFKISASRDQGRCTVTIIVEPLGSRTSLVVYLGEGCPAP